MKWKDLSQSAKTLLEIVDITQKPIQVKLGQSIDLRQGYPDEESYKVDGFESKFIFTEELLAELKNYCETTEDPRVFEVRVLGTEVELTKKSISDELNIQPAAYQYKCSSCNSVFIIDANNLKYCPACGGSHESERFTMVNKIYEDYSVINQVVTLQEAALLCDRNDSTLRRRIKNPPFVEGKNYRKTSGKRGEYLITRKVLEEVYGARENKTKGRED